MTGLVLLYKINESQLRNEHYPQPVGISRQLIEWTSLERRILSTHLCPNVLLCPFAPEAASGEQRFAVWDPAMFAEAALLLSGLTSCDCCDHSHSYILGIHTFPPSTLSHPDPRLFVTISSAGRERKKIEPNTGKEQHWRRFFSFGPYTVSAAWLWLVAPLSQSWLSTGCWGNETRSISLPNTAY